MTREELAELSARALQFLKTCDGFMDKGEHLRVLAKEYEKSMRGTLTDVACPTGTKPKRFWLSFCDGDMPPGQQFLGACVVEVEEAETPKHTLSRALRKAYHVGANPGGEVLSLEIDDSAPYPLNRLLSQAEIDAIDRAADAAEATP